MIVWKTPVGHPICSNNFSISIPHCIVLLDSFNITVFPAIREGAANLNACQYGKFQGIRLATTPSGSKLTKLFLASVFITSSDRKFFPLSAKYFIAHEHFVTSDLDSLIAFPISFVAILARLSLSLSNPSAKAYRKFALLS